MLLILGNHDPIDDDGGAALKQSVHLTIPEDTDVAGALRDTFADDGPWFTYAHKGSHPKWVACDDDTAIAQVAKRFPGIEIRPVDLTPATPPPEPEAPITRAELRELVRAVIAEERAKAPKA